MVEAGPFELHAGTSSRDLPHRLVIDLDAPSLVRPVDRDSTLHEWLADDRARRVLDAASTEESVDGGLLSDPLMVQVIGSMPMSTLAGFGMTRFTDVRLDEMVARLNDLEA